MSKEAKICYYIGCNNKATKVLDAKLMDYKTGLMTVPFPIDCCKKCYKKVMKIRGDKQMAKKETTYTCRKCGDCFTYEKLEKIITHTIEKAEYYYHRCPVCKGTKFVIRSIVERL